MNHQGYVRRAAAVQLEGVVGDVAENLRRLDRLVADAAGQGAELIAIPEFFTSRIPFDAGVHAAVLPLDNLAVDALKAWAARDRCWIGGSMLVAEDERVVNRYHLVAPDGTVYRHDKDLPTMWENAFYGPGDDDGVFETPIGPLGAAVCWELIRTATVRRMRRGRVVLAMTGTHWWTMPSNWGSAVNRALAALSRDNAAMSEGAPVAFAKRLGAPVLQASHCGHFDTGFMVIPGLRQGLPYRTEYVGATQIVDARGQVLVARRAQEGPGVVVADVRLEAVDPVVPLEDRFWIPDLHPLIRAYWHHQNACGRSYYRQHGRMAGLHNARTLS
jgi:predicted amidohydrolase